MTSFAIALKVSASGRKRIFLFMESVRRPIHVLCLQRCQPLETPEFQRPPLTPPKNLPGLNGNDVGHYMTSNMM